MVNTREAGSIAERFYLYIECYFRFISEPGIDANLWSAD